MFSCTEFEGENQVEETVTEYPDQESWDATIYFTKDGNRRAVLKAGYIAKYSKKRITLLKERIKVDFFDKDGQHRSTLTANEGKIFDAREDMTANGNVVVKSNNGNRLYSEELKWDNTRQKIISEVPVMLVSVEGDTSYGNTLITDPELTEYELTDTRGSFKSNISFDE